MTDGDRHEMKPWGSKKVQQAKVIQKQNIQQLGFAASHPRNHWSAAFQLRYRGFVVFLEAVS
jgi:hypothetical protein